MIHPPDYNGHGLYNLMSRLAEARGAPAPGPPLTFPGHECLDTVDTLVFWLVDGLGDRYLRSHPSSTLFRHRVGGATSVFPATTTAAVTTVNSGLPPRQHGATGWFMYLRELGACSTWLPFGPRAGRATWPDILPGSEVLLERPALTDGMQGRIVHALPAWLVDTPYTRATSGDAERLGYRGLDGLVDRVVDAATGRDTSRTARYIYAYWPDLDAECHRSGVGSPETEACFARVDRAFEQLIERLSGCHAAVIVTADHGLIDTAPERVIDLTARPELADCLALPLCGEPRAGYAYLRAGAEADFDAGVRETFGDRLENRASAAVIDDGWFGPVPEHPEFRRRVGDRVLLPADGWVVRDRLWHEGPFGQIGVHGGVSAEEMQTPIIAALPE